MGRHSDKGYVHLQRRVAQQTEKLRFRFDFGGHKVENQNAQRPDLLALRV